MRFKAKHHGTNCRNNFKRSGNLENAVRFKGIEALKVEYSVVKENKFICVIQLRGDNLLKNLILNLKSMILIFTKIKLYLENM